MDPELETYLRPQERFEELRRACAARAGRQLCDLAYANFQDGPPAEVIATLRDILGRSRTLQLQYTPYGGLTLVRKAVADQLAATHHPDFQWEDVILTPGAMAALNLVFRALRAEPGRDEIIVPTPCWLDYPLYLAHLGIRPVLVPLAERTHRLAVAAIADALTPHTRAVVLSQPANPTGVLYARAELEQLATALHAARDRFGRPIALISDECHRDVVFPPGEFISPLRCYPFCFSIYSFGKRLQIQGQRIGYAAVSPAAPRREALRLELERLCRVMGFCTPTALMQQALGRLMRLPTRLAPIQKRRARMLAALRESGYEVQPSEATFFLYPRTPAADDFEFAERLAARGVLVLPAPVFHHRGHFRISLTASDVIIDRAIAVLRDLPTGVRA